MHIALVLVREIMKWTLARSRLSTSQLGESLAQWVDGGAPFLREYYLLLKDIYKKWKYGSKMHTSPAHIKIVREKFLVTKGLQNFVFTFVISL